MGQEGMPPPYTIGGQSVRTDISLLGGVPSAFDLLLTWPFAVGFSRPWPVEAAGVDREGIAPEGSHGASGRYGSADRHSVVRGSMYTHVGFPQDGAPD
jgi:hypothetical protein